MATDGDRTDEIEQKVEQILGHVADLTTAGNEAVDDFIDPTRVSDIGDLDLGAVAGASWRFLAKVTQKSAQIVELSAQNASAELAKIREDAKNTESNKKLESPLGIVEHVAKTHGDLAAGIVESKSENGTQTSPATIDEIAVAVWNYWTELGRAGVATANLAKRESGKISSKAGDVVKVTIRRNRWR